VPEAGGAADEPFLVRGWQIRQEIRIGGPDIVKGTLFGVKCRAERIPL